MATQPAPTSNRGRVSAWHVFLVFLTLGCTSFGGPTAHLGYFRTEFVTRRRWLSDEAFADMVALSQFLPGPGSSQVGFGIGLTRAGLPGAIAAFIGFTLPSAILMVAFAYGASLFTGSVGAGILSGLQIVAVAIVAVAVWGMARTLTPDLRRIIIALMAAGLTLALPGTSGQISALAVGIVGGVLWCRRSLSGSPGDLRTPISRRFGAGALTMFVALCAGIPLAAWMTGSDVVAQIGAYVRAGALVFGGGHVVLPLLEPGVVLSGAVTQHEFLAGYGAAQALPGPLFTFASYLGTLSTVGVGGLAGALIATLAIFLPGLLLLLGVLPFWKALKRYTSFRAAVAGVNATVVGILAATLYDPVFTTAITSVWSFGVSVICVVFLTMFRIPVWCIVLAGAGAGVLLEVVT